MSLKELIQEEKKHIFDKNYKATDEETLGIMISQYGKWDGSFIFKVAQSGFEDSNFHSFNSKFEKLWNGKN